MALALLLRPDDHRPHSDHVGDVLRVLKQTSRIWTTLQKDNPAATVLDFTNMTFIKHKSQWREACLRLTPGA